MSLRVLLICFCLPCLMGWAGAGVHTANPVPLGWVVRARLAAEKGAPIDDLVREFAGAHCDPDVFPTKSEDWMVPYLSIVPVDLNGDGDQELVLFISGMNKETIRLYFLMREGDHWRVAYTHPANAHNQPPPYKVLDGGNGQRVFSFVNLEDYGAGIWRYSRLFLRSVNEGVTCALELIDGNNFALPGHDLEGNVYAQGIASQGDDLKVSYVYEFSGAFPLVDKLRISSNNVDKDNQDRMLVKGNTEVTYRWESGAKKYRLIHALLTVDQLRCFARLNDEQLFCEAFRNELRSLARKGTPSQRVLARHFLRMHRKGYKIRIE